MLKQNKNTLKKPINFDAIYFEREREAKQRESKAVRVRAAEALTSSKERERACILKRANMSVLAQLFVLKY